MKNNQAPFFYNLLIALPLVLAISFGFSLWQSGGALLSSTPYALRPTLLNLSGTFAIPAAEAASICTAEPTVASADEGRIYFNKCMEKFRVSTNTGAWADLGLSYWTLSADGTQLYPTNFANVNVGIGKLDPATALDVTGQVFVDPTNTASLYPGSVARDAFIVNAVVDAGINPEKVAVLKTINQQGFGIWSDLLATWGDLRAGAVKATSICTYNDPQNPSQCNPLAGSTAASTLWDYYNGDLSKPIVNQNVAANSKVGDVQISRDLKVGGDITTTGYSDANTVSPVVSAPSVAHIMGLATDAPAAAASNRLAIAAWSDGHISRSTDGGRGWVSFQSPVTTSLTTVCIGHGTSENNALVVAAGKADGSNPFILWSDNGGQTFTKINNDNGLNITFTSPVGADITAVSCDSDVVAVLFESSSSGKQMRLRQKVAGAWGSWNTPAITSPPGAFQDVVVVPDSTKDSTNKIVLAVTSGALWRSVDAGLHFSPYCASPACGFSGVNYIRAVPGLAVATDSSSNAYYSSDVTDPNKTGLAFTKASDSSTNMSGAGTLWVQDDGNPASATRLVVKTNYNGMVNYSIDSGRTFKQKTDVLPSPTFGSYDGFNGLGGYNDQSDYPDVVAGGDTGVVATASYVASNQPGTQLVWSRDIVSFVSFRGVWAGTSTVVTVGDSGAMASAPVNAGGYSNWTPLAVAPATTSLAAIAGTTTTALAVGSSATGAYFNGTSWSTPTLPDTSNNDIWVGSAGDAYIVGNYGTSKKIYHAILGQPSLTLANPNFVTEPATVKSLTGVSGLGTNFIVAVGVDTIGKALIIATPDGGVTWKSLAVAGKNFQKVWLDPTSPAPYLGLVVGSDNVTRIQVAADGTITVSADITSQTGITQGESAQQPLNVWGVANQKAYLVGTGGTLLVSTNWRSPQTTWNNYLPSGLTGLPLNDVVKTGDSPTPYLIMPAGGNTIVWATEDLKGGNLTLKGDALINGNLTVPGNSWGGSAGGSPNINPSDGLIQSLNSTNSSCPAGEFLVGLKVNSGLVQGLYCQKL